MFASVKQFYWGLRADIPILRCVFGVTLGLIVSTSLGYLIPHITAVFALMFLDVGNRPLGLKKEFGLVLLIFLLGYFGVFIGYYLIDYPLVIVPLMALFIFLSFRLNSIPQPVRLLFLMLSMLIPFISMKAEMLGTVVLSAMLFNLIIAMIVVRISFLIFPYSEKEDLNASAQKKALPYKNIDMDKLAFNGLLVLFPLILMFYLFNSNIAILTLVFVLLLGLDPFIYQSKKGAGLILANVIGGAAGILAYNILVIAPSYLLYIFVVLSFGFYFAINLFSGKKLAPVFKISFNTFFVVMGTIATSTNEAGDTIWERLLQIGLAVIYLVVAFRVVNKLNNPKQINA
mgnify:CR=1 FL=1